MRSSNSGINPVFVFGISGATWTVIKPLIDKGRLPNMQSLMEQGCHGTIHSIRVEGDKHYRPQTAWPTLATSAMPKSHGITQFWHTSDELEVETIWDVYQRNGHRVGLYGWPITWPPPPMNGFVIPCHHARDTQTWPKELSSIKELDQGQKMIEREKGIGRQLRTAVRSSIVLVRHGIRVKTFQHLGCLLLKYLTAKDSEERALLLRYAKLEISIDFFLNLHKRWSPDFANFTSFLADLVSHRYWRYYEPEKFGEIDQDTIKLYGGSVEEAYEKLDAALGRCIAELPDNSIVAVVSEHGMSAEIETTEVGPYRYVIQGASLLNLVGFGEELIACPVARWIAVRHHEGDILPAYVAEKIKSITVIETGLPLFNVHSHGNLEVIVKFNIDHKVPSYKQGNLEKLTVSYNGKNIPFLEITRRLGRQRSAMHDSKAVFMIAGTGIKKGVCLSDFNLLDFAPTILHVSGLTVPSTFQGKVLDIFE